jgi:hypothetical protein
MNSSYAPPDEAFAFLLSVTFAQPKERPRQLVHRPEGVRPSVKMGSVILRITPITEPAKPMYYWAVVVRGVDED